MRLLKAPPGTRKSKKIVGRGNGSGVGGTCGRGHNGQNSRSGGGVRPGFEGGQMPLFRRVARRGFSNHRFKKEYATFSLAQLEIKYKDGEKVDLASLKSKGLVKNSDKRVKLLANGKISRKLIIKIDKMSKNARERLLKAGCQIIEEKEAKDGK